MTPRTVACQAPLSLGFPRQEYCSGLPVPSPGALPDLEIEPGSSALQADFLPSEPPGKPKLWKISVNSKTTALSLTNSALCLESLLLVCSSFSCVRLFATPWSVACQVPLSMEFSRQEHWSGLPFPTPGVLPNAGIKPGSLELQADSLWSVSLFLRDIK